MSSYDNEVEHSTVRPYAVTGGRVRSATSDLPLEALVEATPASVNGRGLTPEKREILRHAATNYVSVAELSALVRLPIGVVRIVISDLADEGFLTVHTSTPVNVHTGHGQPGFQNPALSLSVLESVLNGISSL
ncbi:DUF742 domain-containing protein [Sanguibacter sp. A247]|uniref:DUF742 domain-containing protein n=1 Tax=unclassified Sanguibacter TaxID=2645534 RepID=UPI003FD723F9